MSSYSSVALVGAGDFGTIFATTLAANPAFNSVVVITRPESASAKQVPAGTKVAEADLTKVDSVAAVLKEHKVDVVISTLGFAGLSSGSQVVVADAAKAAGVKLFVPSEWGFPTIGATEGLFGVKESNAKHLASIGVPSLRVFTGVFSSWLPLLVGYPTDGKVSYVEGSDTITASTTTEEDIAGFVSYIITHLKPEQLENKAVTIEGDKVTHKDLAAVHGTTTQKVDTIPGDASGFITFLGKLWASGAAETGPVDNHLWAGHEWTKYKNYAKK